MIIDREHFRYLSTQHGRIAQKENLNDFSRWKAAYEASLQTIFRSVFPVLPARCTSILDIGSGLGGIDILLSAYYGVEPHVRLLDGEDDPPEVQWSFKPHNSMKVAEDFLAKNGVHNFGYFTPGTLRQIAEFPKFDLVVSFAAYGFHIPPTDYLADLKTVVHDKTVIILEVRRTRDDWLKMFVDAFGVPKVLDRAEKYVRCAFRG